MKLNKLILLFLLTTFSLSADAIKFKLKYQDVYFKFETINDKEVRIIDIDGNAKNIIVPSAIMYKGGTFLVKSISIKFPNMVYSKAETIEIEHGVEKIENKCFYNFDKLNSVTFPTSLKYIGKNVFNSSKLLSITIPEGVEEIDEKAFYHCNKLQILEIPNTIRHIGKNAFKDNNGLRVITPNTIAEFDVRMGNEINVNANLLAENKRTVIVKEVQEEEENEPDVYEKSNIDTQIPQTNLRSDNTYCIIIANENYTERDIPNVDYALNDGKVFSKYCKRTLGIQDKRTRILNDATLGKMKSVLNWLKEIAAASDGNSKIIFYYAGHAFPGEGDNSVYLLPSDGTSKDLSSCIKMQDIYNELGDMNIDCAVVLLDACFSGNVRGADNVAINASRGVGIRPKKDNLSGNVVAITAASGNETAMAFKEEGHGMFTFSLLSSLQKSRGNISLEKLFDEISKNVRLTSLEYNDKSQTPSLLVSPAMENRWKGISLGK